MKFSNTKLDPFLHVGLFKLNAKMDKPKQLNHDQGTKQKQHQQS